jgi:hypothetical protein
MFMPFLFPHTLGAADPYEVISKQNLFSPDRQEWVIDTPDSKTVDKKIDTDSLELHGTIIIGDKKSALIRDKKEKSRDKKTELYSLGDYIGGYVLAAIEAKSVVLDYYGEKVTLYLHEGKESSDSYVPPPPEERPKPKKPNRRTAARKPKKEEEDEDEEDEDEEEEPKSGRIPEALAKSAFMSEENMKKILEFNKEIMEELKDGEGQLDQDAIKDKVEKFRERFMDEMGRPTE